jgi:hypothetical protein
MKIYDNMNKSSIIEVEMGDSLSLLYKQNMKDNSPLIHINNCYIDEYDSMEKNEYYTEILDVVERGEYPMCLSRSNSPTNSELIKRKKLDSDIVIISKNSKKNSFSNPTEVPITQQPEFTGLLYELTNFVYNLCKNKKL